ncbi:MAG: LLM class F420-dependent oxidoreductase, partial [Deltaproteobacteria bacterium]
ERTNLVGDEGWVKERIAVYKEAGVRTLSLMPVGDVARIVDKVREWAA